MISTTSPQYKWWLLALMMISTAMAILDTTIINSVIPALTHDFHESLNQIEWIVTGYLLSMCVMLPTAGWFAGKWGYKRIYITGMVLFTLGSYLCYISESLSMLIFSRVVEGIGSGVVQSLGLAIIIRHFDSRNRPLALGLWGIASAAAVSMGPYLGGELLHLYGWNSLFIINVPIGIANFTVAAIVMKEVYDKGVGRFNLLGFLLTGLPAPLLVVGLALGVVMGWGSILVIALLGSSVLLCIGFVRYNKRSSEPFIDLSIFSNRNFTLSVIALTGLGFGFYGGNYLFPLYMEHSMSYTAVMVGGFYLPVGLIQGVLAPFSGVLARRTGEWILVVVGLAIFCIYLWMSAWYGLGSSFGYIVVSVLLRGIGLGLSFTSLNALAVKTLSHSQMTSASGINNTVKQVSGSLGIAIFTAMLTSSKDYVEAVDSSFYIALGFALVALLSVLLMQRR